MEIRTPKPLDTLWMKAAVVGSLWASVEIILGSFLHNLKVPLSGTLLSFISVYILIAFAQVWRERGLIWRAGLICALMKSISPSALIIGPMVGIFTEAILLELFILLLGRNPAGYFVGGAFAVFSTILHKTVSLLILYGFDFIKILDALYKFAVKQIRLEDASPKYLIAAIALLYLITGLVAGFLGMRAGRKYLHRKEQEGAEPLALSLQTQNKLFAESSTQSYSVLFLLANVAAVVTGLYLINFNYYLPAAVFSAGYVAFVLWRYKSSVRHFRKGYLWVQFLLITLIAAFLWNSLSKGVFFSMEGLVIGLKMTARAVLIITGFAAVGVELRNPVIKSILYDRRLSNLYQALSLAFSVLPHILSKQPKTKELLSKDSFSFHFLFRQAEGLLLFLETEHLRRPAVIVITGEVQEGKTTYLKQIVERLREEGIRVGGFMAIGVHEGEQRTGFDLWAVETGEVTPLCTTAPEENALRIGKYYFHAGGLAQGHALLSEPQVRDKQLIVIDELGPLELSNRGWSESVAALIRNSSAPQLWVVRKPLVEQIVKHWNIGKLYILEVGVDGTEDALAAVAEAIEERRALVQD